MKLLLSKILPCLGIAALLSADVVSAAEATTGDELKSQQKSSLVFKSRDSVKAPGLKLERKDMAWWEDAKFGLFIHWGLYAIPARGEWTMHNDKIPAAEYAKLADEFNPKHFDANEWARVAKAAGMKYIVLTARHHDGFALWDSPASYGDFDSMETAAHRDFVVEYTKACRDAGLRVGLYYSPMDWRFPGYFKPKELTENAALMKKQGYGQIEELMSKYGRIDVLWYDGGWLAHEGTDADAAWFWEPVKLNQMVRKHQPLAVINPRSGWEGDFQCDEGGHDVTGPIVNDVPWEKCLNLNMASWGFNNWQNLMTRDAIIRMLVNVVGRGGNVLLNVGPDRDGVIPPTHVQRLREVGQWLETHGEAIYATRPGPFQSGDWGVSTHRDKTVYVHVLKWPGDKLKLPALPAKVLRASVVTGGEVNVSQNENGIELTVPPANRSDLDTVIALELDRSASSLPLVDFRADKSPITVPSPLNAPLQWTVSDAVVKPASDARGIVSVKDPSVVRYNDRWHIYATTANTNGAWGMVYLNFADWADAANAKPYHLDQNPNLRGYHCAPQIFYFRPHKKWYLIYQSGQPQYSTADDLTKPETWTKPVDFFPTNPPGVARSWLDFWIICDDTHAYLFCTGDNGKMYRSRTKIEDFPHGFSNPEVALEGSRDGVFEGGMTYKIKGANAYLTLVEAIGPGARYYRAWIADRLDGEWKPLPNATTFEQPFAGINNVKFADGVKPWTSDISHGELIRDGYDETPTVDLNNLQLLFQGRDPAVNPSYSQLPYRLGLLRLVSSTTNSPSAASSSTPASPAASIPAPYELATWRGFRASAVSYTFDDNSPKQFSVAQPMFDAKGLPATFFCIVGNLSTSQWATIESASAKGHEIASHTLTHPSLPTLPDDRVAAELSESKNLIESHTGKKCVSHAYPYCAVPKEAITSQYYPFARSCNGSLVPSTPTDFLSIGAMDPVDMNAASDKAAGSGSWLVWLIHGIDNDPACCPITSSVLQSNLDYVAGDTNKWWIETFGNVCRYIQERNASVLTVVSNGTTSITLQLTNSLDHTIFNYPVTLRRPLPPGWQAAAITQNGAAVSSRVVDGRLMFDVLPNGGDIVLSKREMAASPSK